MKTTQKRPFFDTKSVVKRARRLKTQRNLFVVLCILYLVVLSYFEPGFEQR